VGVFSLSGSSFCSGGCGVSVGSGDWVGVKVVLGVVVDDASAVLVGIGVSVVKGVGLGGTIAKATAAGLIAWVNAGSPDTQH
jgi:hypothetical protein